MTELPENDQSLLWWPLPNRFDKTTGNTHLSRRQARNWGLVLEARGIVSQTEKTGWYWQILVPAKQYDQAINELIHYEQENRGWPPPPPPATELIDNRFSTLCVLIAIGMFHNITLQHVSLAGHVPVDWSELGNAHAGKIMAGEWWRLVTALTLHADGLHLMGNLIIGGVFVVRLCRDLGAGLGWSLLLATGIGGNLINAWLQSPRHHAVGASTAIFGAVGLLGAVSMIRYRQNLRLRRRWAIPVAGALGLLAMLGAGGENTDLGAHLWGFLAGTLLGLLTAWLLERHGRPGTFLNLLLVSGTVSVVLGSWWAALNWGS